MCRSPNPPKDYVSRVDKLTRNRNLGHPALLEGGERPQASLSPHLHHSQVGHSHPAAQEGELHVAHSPLAPCSVLCPLRPLLRGPSHSPPPSHQLSLCLPPYSVPPPKKKKDQRPSVATPTTATIQLVSPTLPSPPTFLTPHPSFIQPFPLVPYLNHPIHGSFGFATTHFPTLCKQKKGLTPSLALHIGHQGALRLHPRTWCHSGIGL